MDDLPSGSGYSCMTDAASGNLHMLSKCMAVRSYGFVISSLAALARRQQKTEREKDRSKRKSRQDTARGRLSFGKWQYPALARLLTSRLANEHERHITHVSSSCFPALSQKGSTPREVHFGWLIFFFLRAKLNIEQPPPCKKIR